MKVLLVAAVVSFLVLALLYRAGLRCNLTSSLPKGIYRVVSGAPERDGLVTFCLEGEWAVLAGKRGYLGAGSCGSGLRPLLKYLAALPGDIINILPDGDGIEITSATGFICRWPVEIRSVDSAGQPLPPSLLHSGVIPPGMGAVFSGHPGSFDSRFFGLVPLASMTKVQPVFVF